MLAIWGVLVNDGVDAKALVLQATDIVELIGQTVALKHQGRVFKGLCPFHHEKTPSFQVSPDKQFFYCFGCKEHGNAIDFVMKRDRIDFVEALKLLAEKANVELPKFRGQGGSSGERQLLLDAQSAAGAYFTSLLNQPMGQVAREYLAKRGFTQETIQRFGLGVAAPGWDGLLTSPMMRKFPPEVLLKAGLVKLNEARRSYYDTFRNRLMFPIRDEQGRVIAFGGRVLPGSDDPAKYLNSPETAIFSKSRCAYGLDLGRQRIVETRTVVIVEGYTDAVMCHQYGVSNVVSALGTALTPQHISLLRRFADRIVLLFDPDSAGDMAVNRAVELFLTQPIEILIATLPEAVDPDEYLLAHGPEGFDQVIANAQDALTHKWRQLEKQFRANEGDLTGQQKAVEAYLQTLSNAKGSGPVDALRWGSALARVSRLTGIPAEDLNARFRARPTPDRNRYVAPTRAGGSASQPEPGGEYRQEDMPLPAGPAGAGVGARPRGPITAQVRAERQILGGLLLTPRYWFQIQHQVLLDDFCDVENRKLAEVYWDYQKNEGEPEFAEFLVILKEQGLGELAITLLQEAEATKEINEVLRTAVEYVAYARQQREASKLRAQLRRSSEVGTEGDAAVDLLRKLTEAARQPDARRGF